MTLNTNNIKGYTIDPNVITRKAATAITDTTLKIIEFVFAATIEHSATIISNKNCILIL
jgi:hypothetical protein